jgi:ATP-dependent exoDNAse (exonuclease V) beta subunit
VIAADRLWAYLGTEHPGGTWRREWPVTRVCDGQVLSGWIDLLVEEPSSLSVYDHKSFPGGHERWPEVVAEHAAQLAAYVDALRAATSLAVLRQAIHLPVGGVVLVLET